MTNSISMIILNPKYMDRSPPKLANKLVMVNFAWNSSFKLNGLGKIFITGKFCSL